jgi:hypothetical protein
MVLEPVDQELCEAALQETLKEVEARGSVGRARSSSQLLPEGGQMYGQ